MRDHIAELLSIPIIKKNVATVLDHVEFFTKHNAYKACSKAELLEIIDHPAFTWELGVNMPDCPTMDNVVWLAFGMRMEKDFMHGPRTNRSFSILLPKLIAQVQETTNPYVLEQFSFLEDIVGEIATNPHCSKETIQKLAKRHASWQQTDPWNYLALFAWPMFKHSLLTEQAIISFVKSIRKTMMKFWSNIAPFDPGLVSLLWTHAKSKRLIEVITSEPQGINASEETLRAILRWSKKMKHKRWLGLHRLMNFPACSPELACDMLEMFAQDDLRDRFIDVAKKYLTKRPSEKLSTALRAIEAATILSR